MTPDELQTAYDTITASAADLHARFDQMAPLILELQKKLEDEQADHAATKVQRDTYKTGFEAQTAGHHDAMERLERLRKGLSETEPVPAPDGPPAT